jgi:hypothetical protein
MVSQVNALSLQYYRRMQQNWAFFPHNLLYRLGKRLGKKRLDAIKQGLDVSFFFYNSSLVPSKLKGLGGRS